MRTKAVIFDVDGTLIDTNGLHSAAWVEAFQHFGVKVDPDDVRPAVLILAEGVSPKSHTGLETACAAILGWPSLIQHRNGGAREAFERRAALL
jgi:phosphoglycolate phosphatase-like HAD superfamily hydrolase